MEPLKDGLGNSRSSCNCIRSGGPWSKLRVVAGEETPGPFLSRMFHSSGCHFPHQSSTHLRRSSASVCTPIHDFYGRDYLLRATILIVPSLMGYSTSSTDSLTLLIPPDTIWNGGLMVLLVVQAKSKKTIRMKESYHLHTLISPFAKVGPKNSELQTRTHGRQAISKPGESDGVSVITSYVALGSAAVRR